MEQGYTYHLEAFGGSPAVNAAPFYTDTEGNIILTKLPNPKSHQKCLLQLGQVNGTLTSPKTSPNSNSPDLFYILQGPSGKGEYRLSRAARPKTKSNFIGSSTFFEGWEVKDRGNERLFLRNREVFDSGFWIAVPGYGEKDVWEAWWYSPSAANLEDFEEYVMIDIDLVREDAES